MQIWFNFSAVLSPLRELWELTNFQAGMIVSVFQLGYVAAVLFFGFMSDSRSSQKILIVGALVTGTANLMFAFFAQGFYSALILRAISGIGMGRIYVPGMRLLAGIFDSESRGKAIGLYVGSLVVGSGSSLFLSGLLLGFMEWDMLIVITSMGAFLGAAMVYRLGEIPFKAAASKLDIGRIRKVFSKPNLAMNFGYLGHMWELYAMWPWIAPFLIAMYELHGHPSQSAEMYGNIIGGLSIMIGSIATWVGGVVSDRKGRIKTILVFLVGSIFCSLTIGWIGMWSVYAVSIMTIIYGFLIIGDSPVFSTAITELAEPEFVGLALGVQSVLGFGVTIISPAVFGILLDTTHSWGIAFMSLGIGALIGPIAMMILRKYPESYRMASGKQ